MPDANACRIREVFGAHQCFAAKTGKHQAHQLGTGCFDGETRGKRGGGGQIIYSTGLPVGLQQFFNRVPCHGHQTNMRSSAVKKSETVAQASCLVRPSGFQPGELSNDPAGKMPAGQNRLEACVTLSRRIPAGRRARMAVVRSRPTRLQPLQREAGDFSRVLQIEFVFDVRPVCFHRFGAQMQ